MKYYRNGSHINSILFVRIQRIDLSIKLEQI